MTTSFDLIDEPWVPCREVGGTAVRELGLREVMRRSHELAEIVDSSPLVASALFRLVLVLAHRVIDGPDSGAAWRAAFEKGRFGAAAVDRYFERWAERFDLFSPTRPFHQIPDFTLLEKNGDAQSAKTVAVLAQELASANNRVFFDHSLDDEPEARRPAWAARYLLAAQAWGLWGGQGPTSNLGKHPYSALSPLVGPMQVYLDRANLFEAALFNLTIASARKSEDASIQPLGTPIWERPDPPGPVEGEVQPEGLLGWMTFPTRCIRLVPEVVDGEVRVSGMHAAPGWKPSTQVDDPYTGRRLNAKGDLKLPVRFDPDRAPWRESGALFAATSAGDAEAGKMRPLVLRQLRVSELEGAIGDQPMLATRVVGLANDKAKPLLWDQASLPCAKRILEDPDLGDDLVEVLGRLEKSWQAVRSGVRYLVDTALATDQKKPDPKEVKRQQDALLRGPDFWREVGDGFDPFMRAVTADPDAAIEAWLARARRAAETAFDAAAKRLPGSVSRRLYAVAKAEPVFRSYLRKATDSFSESATKTGKGK